MNDERDAATTARDAASAAEEKIGSMVDTAQQSIVEAVGPAKQSVQSYAERQKSLGAEQIDHVARAARRAAQEVEDKMPRVAQSVHQAAAKLDAASSSLRESSIEDLMTSFGDFARKRPVALFGGAVLAGFALSRFLRTSARR